MTEARSDKWVQDLQYTASLDSLCRRTCTQHSTVKYHCITLKTGITDIIINYSCIPLQYRDSEDASCNERPSVAMDSYW